ncbi:MAG TPA: Fe-S cluster assembly protein HesB [Candidatus Polarisedimenticolia bacterium]|nr:Fe-S cluster assembly protein HesB [Candidatus Polarisedimenticolia bacterium]
MVREPGKLAVVTHDLTLRVPAGFHFVRAVQGHGWFDLPPFSWDEATSTLTRGLTLSGAGPVTVQIRAGRPRAKAPAIELRVIASGHVERADLAQAARDVSHMLRLDEDLDDFYQQATKVRQPDLRWAEAAGAGRLLRSPTVFEDLVKMICTTNCSWALTRVMVGEMVGRMGATAPGGARLFPSPEEMAGRPSRFFRDKIRAGYRAEALRDLAAAVAQGAIRPQTWLDRERPTPEIREEILSIKGAGPYVADNVLKLLGRYDGLGLDAWCRREFSRLHHSGRAVTDGRIARFYAPFGAWRGLALWCDVTKEWLDRPPILP